MNFFKHRMEKYSKISNKSYIKVHSFNAWKLTSTEDSTF